MDVQIPQIVEVPECATRLQANPEEFLAECREKYGLAFTVVVNQGLRITYVMDPHLFQLLLTSRQVDFSSFSRQSKLSFGLGGVVTNTEQVRHLSKNFVSALRGKALNASMNCFQAVLEETVERYCNSLPQETTLQEMVNQTLIPATVQALFGDGLDDQRFIADFLAYVSSISTRFSGSDPTTADDGQSAESALLERLKHVLIHGDTLVMTKLRRGVLARSDISEEERLRTLLMFMWGSMVNLLPTSVWMYASVLAKPELVNDVRASESKLLVGSIVTETLRLFSRPNMYRQVTEDFILETEGRPGIKLKAGDWVALFPRFLHHDPEVFTQPEQFHASRFCPHSGKKNTFQSEGIPLQNATVVFGFGEGRCPGDAYAHRALKIALLTWCRAFDAKLLKLELPAAVRKTPASTPAPSLNIPAYFQRCSSSSELEMPVQ